MGQRSVRVGWILELRQICKVLGLSLVDFVRKFEKSLKIDSRSGTNIGRAYGHQLGVPLPPSCREHGAVSLPAAR
jgi:hypothetical protein